jgi:hypothetical protein
VILYSDSTILIFGVLQGLPFELRKHSGNREIADGVSAQGGVKALQALALALIVERIGKAGPGNASART